MLSHVYPGFYRNTVYEISFCPKITWSYTAAMLAYSEKGETLGIPAAVKTLEMSRPYQTMCCIFVLLLLYALVLMFLQMVFYTVEGAAGRGYQCTDVQCIWAFAESG